MRSRLRLTVGLTVAWLTTTKALVASPQFGNVIISEDTTVNSTKDDSAIIEAVWATATTSGTSTSLKVTIENNYNKGNMYTYVTGTDINGDVVMLTTGNQWYYPSTTSTTPVEIPDSANVAIPLEGMGENKTITLPGYCISCRLYISAAETLTFYAMADSDGAISLVEPSAINVNDASANIEWGFMEFNYEDDDIYADLSYVDFAGIPLGMTLTTTDGEVQTVKGLKAGSVAKICEALQDQEDSDGYPWGDMCMYNTKGRAIRALSPSLYVSESDNSDSFYGYYGSYVAQVWKKYAKQYLTINTQSDNGKVKCKVNTSTKKLMCDGDNRGYSKPTVDDIWSCNSGPFEIKSTDNTIHQEIVPRLCAAFVRSTLMLSKGNVQPQVGKAKYYTTSPTNHYARIVHEYELDGKGYAFSYDDVSPSGENVAGLISGEPELLHIAVGGWGI